MPGGKAGWLPTATRVQNLSSPAKPRNSEIEATLTGSGQRPAHPAALRETLRGPPVSAKHPTTESPKCDTNHRNFIRRNSGNGWRSGASRRRFTIAPTGTSDAVAALQNGFQIQGRVRIRVQTCLQLQGSAAHSLAALFLPTLTTPTIFEAINTV